MILKFPAPKKIEYPPCLPPEKCLAKTLHNGPGCTVYAHLAATCRIFRILREIWHGTRKGELFFPAGEYCAAVHDIGKMTPGFQDKIYRAIDLAGQLPWPQPVLEQTEGHARCSAIVLDSYFRQKNSKLVEMAGSHHGISYKLKVGDEITQVELGGTEWQIMREDVIRQLAAELELPKFDQLAVPDEQLLVMLGSVILADWLSSSLDLNMDSPPPDDTLLKQTIESAGLVPHRVRTGLDFRTLFGFAPNPMQAGCLKQIVPGGIYVIESGMGSGKTEAALALAYELMQKKQADGIYFALPTQLTSEKIYDRLNAFLEKTVDEPEQEKRKAILIHGDSWLDWNLQEPDEDGNSCSAGSWFQSKKRALLASFGAGTIDQALLAEIRVRHNALRAFALAGKVVIFDEIHSYDAYTGSLLEKLIGDLRNWGCTVILLSATLTAEACRRFAHLPEPLKNKDYPRILIQTPGPQSEPVIIPIPSAVSSRVDLRLTEDEEEALHEAIQRAENGEQVLWIENTVRQAQEIFRRAATLAPALETGLIHSRFPAGIRAEKEAYWTDLLGKNGADRRIRHGRILIATQILEQSVDVDADLLITRIAPADFLFQRIGRLWRHPGLDPVRPGGACRQCIMLTPGELADPQKLERESKNFLPYSAYWIRRTWEILRDKTSLSIPEDIRPVLEEIYRDRQEDSDALRHLKAEDEKAKEQLLLKADIAAADLGEIENEDDCPATRFSEERTVQLLLLRKGNRGEKLDRKLCTFFSSDPIELPDRSAPRKKQIETARKLLPLMLKIPEKYAPEWSDFPADFLQHILWTGNDSVRPVRVAYIDESGRILDQSCNLIVKNDRLQFEYQKLLGYIYRKMEG
ncbi:MAG: CRISPR-associated helicase Cas3' [Lentisphaeria bacterium]|nr:CRISPR-associated helicase Cas3' [Lentisphaeria bacterium]